MRADELAAATEGRRDWQVDGETGVYAPGSGWTGRVRAVANPARAAHGWHAAVLRDGVARHTRLSGTAGEAVRWAERLVDACRAGLTDGPGEP